MTILDTLTTLRGDIYQLVMTNTQQPEILYNGNQGYTYITLDEGKTYLERLEILFGRI
jgi:hypothetical protein